MKHEVRNETAAVRLVIEGDVDLHVVAELRRVFRTTFSGKPKLLVVDLGAVPFIDSSGIAAIVEALKHARQWEGVVRVENPREAVRDTFDIAGLTAILGIG